MEQPKAARPAEERKGIVEDFIPAIRVEFQRVRNNESIGSAIERLTTDAFDFGVGRDEFTNLLKDSRICGEGGCIRAALHRCIEAEIEKAYSTGRRATRSMSKSESHFLDGVLAEHLEEMGPKNTVSHFFRGILSRSDEDFERRPTLDPIPDSISRRSFSKWAHGGIARIMEKFKGFMSDTVYSTYRNLIRTDPEAYIKNFLPLCITEQGGALKMRAKNMAKLIADVYGALTQEQFLETCSALLIDMSADERKIETALGDIKNKWDKIFHADIERDQKKEKNRIRVQDYRFKPPNPKPPRVNVETHRSETNGAVSKVIFAVARSPKNPQDKIMVTAIDARNGVPLKLGDFPVHGIAATTGDTLDHVLGGLLRSPDSRAGYLLQKAGIRIARTDDAPEVQALKDTVLTAVAGLHEKNGEHRKEKKKRQHR